MLITNKDKDTLKIDGGNIEVAGKITSTATAAGTPAGADYITKDYADTTYQAKVTGGNSGSGNSGSGNSSGTVHKLVVTSAGYDYTYSIDGVSYSTETAATFAAKFTELITDYRNGTRIICEFLKEAGVTYRCVSEVQAMNFYTYYGDETEETDLSTLTQVAITGHGALSNSFYSSWYADITNTGGLSTFAS